MTEVLTCDRLDAGYGTLKVVRGLDLVIRAGELVALLGPNGAGKTTLLHTVAGLQPPLGGELRGTGRRGRRHTAERAVRDGMVLVPDDRCLFSGLTVREHLVLAGRRGGRPAREVLDYFPLLGARLDTAAGNLSGGEQQMLAIGRALALRPKLLLVDELSMGLAPIIVERLLEILRQVAADGTAILFVEQHVHLALAAADRAVVLVHGRVALEGSPGALLDDPQRLERAYLGEP